MSNVQDGGSCAPGSSCPFARRPLLMILLLVLAAVAVTAAVFLYLREPDTDQLFAEYDGLVRAGDKTGAKAVLDRLTGEGQRLYGARKVNEARDVFKEIIARDAGRPLVLNYLGLIARAQHDDNAAVGLFSKAIELDPLTPQHYSNLAIIYMERRQYDEAETLLLQAMKLGLKAQYRFLYARCGEERKLPKEEVVRRYRDVVSVACAQANSEASEALAPGGPLAQACRQACEWLSAAGDDYGWTRVQKLALDAKKSEVKAFAEEVIRQGGSKVAK